MQKNVKQLSTLANGPQRTPANTTSKKSAWSITTRVRLPHKVGQPLSCGGGGDGVL
jgi:hypothetical protein